MVMKVLLPTILACLIFVAPSRAQNDSLRVVKWLDSIAVQPEKQDYYLQQVQHLIQSNEKKSDVFATLSALKAKHELRRGNFDEVDRLLKQVLVKEDLSKRSKAMMLQLRGSLKAVRKDFQAAIEDYQSALRLFDELDFKREAAHVKNNIANILFNLNDF